MREMCLIVMTACLAGGCQNRVAESGETPPGTNGTPEVVAQNLPGKAPQQPQTGVGRTLQRAEAQNLFKQLGLAFRTFEVSNGRGPRNLEELAPEFQRQPKMMEPLKNGQWVFIYNVRQPSANAILAYEAQADLQGNRLVLLGDTSVHVFDEAKFQQTPKAR